MSAKALQKIRSRALHGRAGCGRGYERPALTFRKLRKLELAAGAPKRSNPRGRNGKGTPDNPAQWATDRAQALQTEDHYRTAVANWQPQPQASPS